MRVRTLSEIMPFVMRCFSLKLNPRYSANPWSHYSRSNPFLSNNITTYVCEIDLSEKFFIQMTHVNITSRDVVTVPISSAVHFYTQIDCGHLVILTNKDCPIVWCRISPRSAMNSIFIDPFFFNSPLSIPWRHNLPEWRNLCKTILTSLSMHCRLPTQWMQLFCLCRSLPLSEVVLVLHLDVRSKEFTHAWQLEKKNASIWRKISVIDTLWLQL